MKQILLFKLEKTGLIDLNAKISDINPDFQNLDDFTINDLVRLNKNQRQKIISYEQRMDQMADSNRKMAEKLREQTRDYEKLRATAENFKTVYDVLLKVKPSTVKGVYVLSANVTSTMGPGVKVDSSTIA